MYFLPMTTGVSKVAGHMIALAAARTKPKAATSNRTDHCCRSSCMQLWFAGLCGYSSWDIRFVVCRTFISVVELQFLLYV